MDSMMAVEIKQTLEREFDIFFSAQELRNLTFTKLSEISNASADNTQDINKLDIVQPNLKFLIGVIKDKDFISETCLDFSTKRQKTTTEVFLIPGIDGCGTVFNHLGQNINFSARALCYYTNNIDATDIISDTSDHLINHILPKLTAGKDFIMVGYSFGSIIAIELTKRLEAMNFKGRLILIDGAPEQLRTLYQECSFAILDDTDLQNIVLINIMEIYSAGDTEKILTELKKYKTWEKKFSIFAKEFLATNTSLSLENLKTLCTTVYKYSSAIPQYDSSTLTPMKSSIMLLKATNPLLRSVIEEDYGLQEITQNVVKIHSIEGTHVTILNSEKITAAINGEPPFAI
ncbi:PREDICTED: fatty acid synthase-like [Vollenhovia emeryi]|uniref:fatty acid synthase-like n=1 Tax=Vollenhovia emeryi TaxID=411798 RepID=UPI0005F5132B|nr:PREDICTED: fatty acid synthase-like [Vollenhovia emeryi]